MKLIANVLLASFVILLIGCGKYEDGPNFSLKSEQSRLARKWRINLAYYSEFTDSPEKGINQGDIWKRFTVEFTKNGNYTINNTSQDLGKKTVETGTYQFSDDNIKIVTTGVEIITSTDDNSVISETAKTTTWRIMKLKRNELWVWYQNSPAPPWMYFRMIP